MINRTVAKALRFTLIISALLLTGISMQAQPWPRGINESVRESVAKLSDGHHCRIDEWSQYAPAAAYVAMGLIPGVEHQNDMLRRGCTFACGFSFFAATTLLTKSAVGEMRPDGSGDDSFPSGHSGKAFLGAELVRMEYGNGWGAAAYGVAGMTAFLRIWNDRHWFSDVLAGAALGVLSAHFGDWAGGWLDNRISGLLGDGVASGISYDPVSQCPVLAFRCRF